MQIIYLTNIPIVSVMEHAVIEKANPIALSEDQKAALNKYKIQARKDNEIFLRQHPEVSCLISDFLHEVRSDVFLHLIRKMKVLQWTGCSFEINDYTVLGICKTLKIFHNS